MNKKVIALAIGVAFSGLYGCNQTKDSESSSTKVEATSDSSSKESTTPASYGAVLIEKVPTMTYEKKYNQSNASVLENHFRYGLAPMTEIKSNVDGIYKRLIAASGAKIELPSSINVLNTQSYADNSGEDGNIFISRVILSDADTDDQVAFAVAHEISHLILQHHQSDQVKKVLGQIVGVFEQMDDLNKKSGKTKKTDDTRAKVKVLQMVYDKALHSAWSRSQETDADLLAIDIMSKAGYNVANLNHINKFFDRLENYEAEMAKKSTMENIMSSLQSSLFSGSDNAAPEEKKSGGLGGMLGGGMVGGLLSGKTDADAMKKTAMLAVISGALESLKEDHPTAKDRRENVQAYIDKFYATTAFKKAEKDFVTVAQKNQEMFTSYVNMATINNNIASEQYQDKSVISSIASKHKTMPAVEFYSSMNTHNGKANTKELEKAISNTKVVLPPPEAYRALAKVYHESGDSANAQKTLTKLKNDYGNGEFLKPYLSSF